MYILGSVETIITLHMVTFWLRTVKTASYTFTSPSQMTGVDHIHKHWLKNLTF